MDEYAPTVGAGPDVIDTVPRFYIPAAAASVRRPRTLKHGDTFGVFDHYGDILNGADGSDGLYHRDTRHVSGLQVLLDGQRPLLLSSTVQDNNSLLLADLTNPDFYRGDELILPRDTIHISRAKFIWAAACFERLSLRNFAERTVRLTLTFVFEADFHDLFEVRGHKRPKRGRRSARLEQDKIEFRYRGLDRLSRSTTVSFAPLPQSLTREAATFELTLPPRARTTVFVRIDCIHDGAAVTKKDGFFVCLRQARRDLRQATSGAASVVTSNDIFNEILCRSVSDLYMLMTATDHGPYPYAGIPWFSAAFGRDGIITAMQTLWLDPSIAKGVLEYLAATQAHGIDPESDAEPGKILHERRNGEMAVLGEVPFRLYYGSVDGTPLFVMLAGLYLERTGDVETIARLWPNIEAAIAWIDQYGDADGDGFVEYQSSAGTGLSNQGWKDSHDSVFHADGRYAEGPIALAEVQGYVYAAKRAAARIAKALGQAAVSATFNHEATALKEQFEGKFWCEDIGCYALALDGEKKPCRVRTSNAGHTLITGIASRPYARKIADLLLSRDFFSGWGIRTLASSETRYNPMAYHNGSVWPHDNALIALGLARYGHDNYVEQVFKGLFDAAAYTDLRRLPELFCGFRRQPGKGPTYYPVACSPQAWASAVPFAMLQASLGMKIDHGQRKVSFTHPRLPSFLDEVLLRALRVGQGEVDVAIRRHGLDVSVSVERKVGEAGVSVTM